MKRVNICVCVRVLTGTDGFVCVRFGGITHMLQRLDLYIGKRICNRTDTGQPHCGSSGTPLCCLRQDLSLAGAAQAVRLRDPPIFAFLAPGLQAPITMLSFFVGSGV